jgi:TPR repeat protein
VRNPLFLLTLIICKRFNKVVHIMRIILVFLLLALAGCDPQSPEQAARASEANAYRTAYTMATQLVAQHLKSPTTAKFSSFQETGAEKAGEIWRLSGFVDSQNSFGAMMRSKWYAAIQNKSGDEWSALYIRIGEDEIGDSNAYKSSRQIEKEELARKLADEEAAQERGRIEDAQELQRLNQEAKTAAAKSKAVEFNLSAANRGDAYGQFRMGERYRDGDGVKKDIETAREWLRKSADQGYVDAKKELARLATKTE